MVAWLKCYIENSRFLFLQPSAWFAEVPIHDDRFGTLNINFHFSISHKYYHLVTFDPKATLDR